MCSDGSAILKERGMIGLLKGYLCVSANLVGCSRLLGVWFICMNGIKYEVS